MMSALTRNRSKPTNVPNHINKEYYTQRAEGGAGIIVTEATLVSKEQSGSMPLVSGVTSRLRDGRRSLRVCILLGEEFSFSSGMVGLPPTALTRPPSAYAVGRVAHPDAPEQKQAGVPVYAPSALSARGGKFRFIEGHPGYVTPTAVLDPRTLIVLYQNAAIKAKEAGFDGVELHCANGYLVHQFLDNTSNKRTDKWGGSVENRCRFGLETLKTIINIWGAGRVGIKLSPCGGYNDMGMPLSDTIATYNHFVAEVDKLGIAYTEFVRHSDIDDEEFEGESSQYTFTSVSYPLQGIKRSTPHDVVKTYRSLFKHAKFVVNGGVLPDEGERLIQAGEADIICFGELFISNPDLPKRLQQEKELSTNLDDRTLYGVEGGVEEQRRGYTDYPTAT